MHCRKHFFFFPNYMYIFMKNTDIEVIKISLTTFLMQSITPVLINATYPSDVKSPLKFKDSSLSNLPTIPCYFLSLFCQCTVFKIFYSPYSVTFNNFICKLIKLFCRVSAETWDYNNVSSYSLLSFCGCSKFTRIHSHES